MQFLFKIGPINFDYASIISFIVGAFLGASLIALFYAILVLISLRNEKYGVKTKEEDLDEDTVNKYIKEAQDQYKDKELRKEKGKVGSCYDISIKLAKKIAYHYFPNSKTPLYELSVDELLKLTLYVEGRIEELLNRKGIRLLKKIKVSDIVAISKKTTNVVNSRLFKVTMEVNEKVSVARKVLNVINPSWWIKKGVIDTSMGVVTNKICLIIISIVGEETYKIYSKKIFERDSSEEDSVESLVSGIENDIITAASDIKDIEREEEKEILTYNPQELKLKRKVICYDINIDNCYTSSYNSNYKLKDYNQKHTNSFLKIRNKMEEN